MQKVFTVYVEIFARGDSEAQIQGVIEDKLDEVFGAENYQTYEVRELTEDEIIELESGVNDDEVAVVSGDITDNGVFFSEKELDEMDIARDERLSDELGA